MHRSTVTRCGSGLLAAAALACLATSAAAQTKLTTSSWVPPTHHLTKTLVVWSQMVEKATNGRVKIQMLPKHPSAAPGTFDAVKDGLVDISYVTASYTPARHVLPLLAFCPVLAGVVIVERLRAANLGDALRRLFLAVAVVAGALQLLSLYYNARRYAVGLSGPMVFLGDAEWSPRLGWLPWLVLGAAGAVLLAVVAYAGRPRPDPELTPGDH